MAFLARLLAATAVVLAGGRPEPQPAPGDDASGHPVPLRLQVDPISAAINTPSYASPGMVSLLSGLLCSESSTRCGVRRVLVEPISASVHANSRWHAKIEVPVNAAVHTNLRWHANIEVPVLPSQTQQGSSRWMVQTLFCGLSGLAGAAVANPHLMGLALEKLQSQLQVFGIPYRHSFQQEGHFLQQEDVQREENTPAPPAPHPSARRSVHVGAIPAIISLILVAATALRASSRWQTKASEAIHPVRTKLSKIYCKVDEFPPEGSCEFHRMHSEDTSEGLEPTNSASKGVSIHCKGDESPLEGSCEFHRMHSEVIARGLGTTVRTITAEKALDAEVEEMEAVYDSLAAEFYRMSTPGTGETRGFVRTHAAKLNKWMEAHAYRTMKA